ncbi:positive regulator of L-idonate catabolism [Tatumella ptyseos ATCC 33301]|uniref:Positive regulator of L-idonate catabolism n=2 Tax=Tatumella ptyseos TaxID=82987 RepID=A0A085J978_9GAMM|nr:LacI family DNA-binding transcriptional regulator [Tatumella ptyseos]KFD17024.1 positive regulator of L-idonate catabolism [Tatumella ptyseos ATCC 33301]SQK72440.1 Gluconate utilization system GNT-I transcriptional repressor [Tatumella ptyseos]
MKRNRMSLQDIATLAGLTKMTVSRYMRDPSKVSERSRCAIDEVMRQHNYIPNRLPEMLSGAGSKTLGVIIPSFRNQIFSDVLEGIQQVAEKHGYQTIIASDNYDPLTGQEKIITLLSYHIDGLLLTGTQHTQTARDYLKTSGIPVAELMEITSDPLDIQVGFDNRQAAFDMTGEFVRRGKKQMAFIGAMDDPRDVSRYQGMTQALQEYGLSGHHYVPGAISSMVLGRRLFQQIIAQHPQTDAIFCTNDDLAMGVLLECQARLIRVPEDIAIAGFHGLDIGSANQQKLASVITPRLEAGQVATGLLIAQLEGRRTAGSETVDLGYRLFTGDTL